MRENDRPVKEKAERLIRRERVRTASVKGPGEVREERGSPFFSLNVTLTLHPWRESSNLLIHFPDPTKLGLWVIVTW